MLGLAIAIGCWTGSAAGLSQDELSADCATETYAVNGQSTKIKFIVWCGVRSDDVSFTLRRSKEERIEGYQEELKAWGRGAVGPLLCHRRGYGIRCAGRKEGPVKVQGWITVEDGRCDVGVIVDLGGLYVGKPVGCPGVQRYWPHWNLRHLQGERRQFGFDADLDGNQPAIEHRIRGLIRAWRRGEPVARATAGFLYMPMRAWEQREWEYRSEYVSQFPEALNPWVSVYARDTYAGYYVDHEHGGTIYIGFVGDQQAQLDAFIASGGPMAPERLRPFQVPPKFSWGQLLKIQSELTEISFVPGAPGWRIINRIGIDIQDNVVEVSTEQVEVVRKLIDERFGAAAPIVAVYGRPIPGVRKAKPKKSSASGRTPSRRSLG